MNYRLRGRDTYRSGARVVLFGLSHLPSSQLRDPENHAQIRA